MPIPQASTGTAFGISMICQREAIKIERGTPKRVEIEMSDGRVKQTVHCPRCRVSVWSEPKAAPNLLTLRPGTLDDTSWLAPIGHIWTRSAQPWVSMDPAVLRYEKQPTPAELLDLIRAWKNKAS